MDSNIPYPGIFIESFIAAVSAFPALQVRKISVNEPGLNNSSSDITVTINFAGDVDGTVFLSVDVPTGVALRPTG